MRIISSIQEMQEYTSGICASRRQIGFVPTMGALHDGHLSLLKQARAVSNTVVMSIFVNPTQFGKGEDFDKYPRVLERDTELARNNGCDILFTPTVEELYPVGIYKTFVSVKDLSSVMCGITRPDHFTGVATIVLKFFNIIQPYAAIFGHKDAQQVIVLKRMVEDLNVPVKIVVAPTMRESDGLALSSRNVYLTPEERAAAPLIYRGLSQAKTLFEQGITDGVRLRQEIESVYRTSTLFTIEYVSLVDTVSLNPALTVADRPVLCAIACRTTQSKTRLIDNIVLGGAL